MIAWASVVLFALSCFALGGLIATLIDGRKLRQLSHRIDEVVDLKTEYVEHLERELAAHKLGVHQPYPVTHALGLGPALDEIERVFAIGAAGKYAGQTLDPNPQVHIDHALDHMTVGAANHQARDPETGERELAHTGARLLAALRTSGGEL